MRKTKVNLGKRSYEIVVGYGILNRLPGYIQRFDIGRDAGRNRPGCDQRGYSRGYNQKSNKRNDL